MSPEPKTFNLNQGQQAAADFFFEFLLSDSEKYMIISGPAGVGKSYLTGYLIDRILPNYEKMCSLMGIQPKYREVAMTATTNKAAAVTGEATGRPSMTIHGLLGLVPKVDYSTGKVSLVRTRNWKMHENKIIFVDECSMVDYDLLTQLDESTLNCKIVFVGDHCQLGPVNETISPIYNHGLPFFNLTEPMRNAGQPALVDLCNQLRNTVETGEFKPIKTCPGVIDHVDAEVMQDLIAEHFHENNPSGRILAYTNQQVNAYNTHIRDLRGLQEEFIIGERLVNNNAFQMGKQRIRIEEEVEIINQSSSTEMLEIERPLKGAKVELEVRRTDLRDAYGGVLAGVPLPVDRQHHIDLTKYYARQKKWERHYHLKENIPDLRQRDAATIHKAQGSTYDIVFVDLGNLSTCHQPNTAARLLNVAISRARSRVILYGDLSEKYGGNPV